MATAILNSDTRDELIASRARIVAAGDAARRQLERDLHDGAQQRLVTLGLQFRTTQDLVPPEQAALKERLSDLASSLASVSNDLQEIGRGIHPAILSSGGLGKALKVVARRAPVPVSLDVAIPQRLPEQVEVAAYYVVTEALTNAAKHARASQITVMANAGDENLLLRVHDDGIGGADFDKGSGLIGLKDRVEALGGQLTVSSPVEKGTSLNATIPLHHHDKPRDTAGALSR